VTSEPEARLGAFVDGYSAHVLDGLLFKYGTGQVVTLEKAVQRGTLPDAYRVEFIQTWRSIHAAARAWVAERGTGQRASVASADGPDSSRSAEAPTSSIPEMVDTDQAAEVLRVTASRVRQLCRSGVLPARKTAGAWLVSADGLRRYRGIRDGQL